MISWLVALLLRCAPRERVRVPPRPAQVRRRVSEDPEQPGFRMVDTGTDPREHPNCTRAFVPLPGPKAPITYEDLLDLRTEIDAANDAMLDRIAASIRLAAGPNAVPPSEEVAKWSDR